MPAPRRAAVPTALPKRTASRARLAPREAAAPASIALQIDRRIARASAANPARVYTPFDFLDLGTPHSVGMALMRLVRRGALRHLARGLYDVPRRHALLGELQPTADEIAQALARRDGASVQPSEAMAANLLSLSEQVPARAVYETDGPSRNVKVGSLTVQLKKRPPRQVRSTSPMSHLVFAALRSVGNVQVNPARIAHLRNTLSARDRAQLLEDLPLAPAWMHPHLRFIAGDVSASKTKPMHKPTPVRTVPSSGNRRLAKRKKTG